MSQNPINLAVRFMLELAALTALGVWGWHVGDGLTRWLFAIGAPLVAAAAWGTFRVPNDGGRPVVVVVGPLRLFIEALVFGSATAGLWAIGAHQLALAFGAIVALHYAVSHDRVARLLRNEPLGSRPPKAS